MLLFEVVIALLLGGAVLSVLARRMRAPYPALLALAGAGLALVPDASTVNLDPELALTLVVAPVPLDAAFDASPRDLRRNWRAVTSLAVLAVGLTVVAVAVVLRWLVDVSWPVAIAAGAIIAPPDAAAATAVLRQLRPPHRVLVILEGESLFNDASALLVYRVAVATAVTGVFAGWSAVPALLLACAGSVALGVILAWIVTRTLHRIEDAPISIIVQLRACASPPMPSGTWRCSC
ncbi:MAG TPA: cation:proton antiporter [Haliangiales bacterium]|nr:cation:proton antiporter [Haliangiales bacterium]